MNIFVMLLSTLFWVSPDGIHETHLDSAINHVVTYVTYPNSDLVTEDDESACKTSFYLFSNHTDKVIKVKYKKVEGETNDTATTTLYPMYADKSETGSTRTITRPVKFDGSCQAQYEIIEAWYVSAEDVAKK